MSIMLGSVIIISLKSYVKLLLRILSYAFLLLPTFTYNIPINLDIRY